MLVADLLSASWALFIVGCSGEVISYAPA